jgi:hypothetical protein
MEIALNNNLPFCGMNLSIINGRLAYETYHKPTDTGLLLHFDSFVDVRYKKCLIKTMLHRAYNFNSNWHRFLQEVDHLWSVFSALRYPRPFFDAILNQFLTLKFPTNVQAVTRPSTPQLSQPVVRFVIPYKGGKASLFLKSRFSHLSSKIGAIIHPVFVSRKLSTSLRPTERKPDLVSQQCVVYHFKCDQCDADYVGMTSQHLHQRIQSHKSGESSIARHYKQAHKLSPKTIDIEKCFRVLKKCRTKFHCLINEMLLIRKMSPTLNVQCDSLKAKLFV